MTRSGVHPPPRRRRPRSRRRSTPSLAPPPKRRRPLPRRRLHGPPADSARRRPPRRSPKPAPWSPCWRATATPSTRSTSTRPACSGRTPTPRRSRRAFDQLETQEFTFDQCAVDVTGATAVATCRGRAAYTPKVGSRTLRVEARRWTFRLEKMNGVWVDHPRRLDSGLKERDARGPRTYPELSSCSIQPSVCRREADVGVRTAGEQILERSEVHSVSAAEAMRVGQTPGGPCQFVAAGDDDECAPIGVEPIAVPPPLRRGHQALACVGAPAWPALPDRRGRM